MRPRLDDCIACAVLASAFTARQPLSPQVKERQLQVFVRDNNVDQALRVLKKKMQREGVFREMKRRRFYEKPSEQSAREKSEAVRRSRKLARKQAIFDGSIAAPRKKPGLDANGKPRSAERGRPPTRR
jgi:small subunit ribosomal protein S21